MGKPRRKNFAFDRMGNRIYKGDTLTNGGPHSVFIKDISNGNIYVTFSIPVISTKTGKAVTEGDFAIKYFPSTMWYKQ